METQLGGDFSAVRIHTGETAATSAASVHAQAYTVGNAVVFGAGIYAPGSPDGRRMLAHELVHVQQQRRGPVTGTDTGGGIAVSDPGDRFEREAEHIADLVRWTLAPAAEGLEVGPAHEGPDRRAAGPLGTQAGGPRGTQATWPAVQRQASTTSPPRGPDPARADPLSYPWEGVPEGYSWALNIWPRFASMPSADEAKRLIEDLAGADQIDACTIRFGGTLGIKGWWSFIHPTRGEIGRVIGLTDAPSEERAATTNFAVYLVYALPPAGGTGQKEGPGERRPTNRQAREGSGSLARAAEQAKRQQGEMASRLSPAPELLKEPMVAAFYLQILEHFSGRPISAADEAAAKDGLTTEEVNSIVGLNALRRSLTDLFTQGLAEFRQAGGADFEQYKLLIQTVDEQFTRGNPTAALNRLKIGKGFPETDVLGIADRNSRILLYDQFGIPLPALGGGGLMRDHGYIGSRNQSRFGFNIADIEDPAIRQLLDSLRQSFGDPVLMAFEAAGIYFQNIQRVNAEVRAGLSAEIIQKFEDMIVPFTGFIAGHAVASFLMRFPNPQIVLIGVALEGLLTTAGYVMDVQFAAGVLERLTQAAAELIKVEKNEKGQLTKLSQAHIANAAVPIQQMIADIALMAGTKALGSLLRLAALGRNKLKIECTHCKLDDIAAKAGEEGGENIPPEKPQVDVPPMVRGFAVEDFHLDRVGYQSLRKAGAVTGIDGIRGGAVEIVPGAGEMIMRYKRPDAVSVKSTTITDPAGLTRKVTGELGALRGRYRYKGKGIEIDGLGRRSYDLVFEEGAFSKFTKGTLDTLANLKTAAGSIIFRWYVIIGGHEYYGPDYLKLSKGPE